MSSELVIDEILQRSQQEFNRLTEFCIQFPDDLFFQQPSEDKWSAAQHLKHLIISTRITSAAYALPKFLVRMVGGRPNRASRSYEALVAKYQAKLQQGGKASGRYIPGKINASIGKNPLLTQWKKVTGLYLDAIKKNWTNNQLDKYIVSHPLLGKITLRELSYFTIYHTYHHYNSIMNSKLHKEIL